MTTYTVIVHEEAGEEGGGFWAEVVELPGCYASGDSLDELERDVREAIQVHIAALQESGLPVPEGHANATDEPRRWEIAVG